MQRDLTDCHPLIVPQRCPKASEMIPVILLLLIIVMILCVMAVPEV